jgi:hypothetical protein
VGIAAWGALLRKRSKPALSCAWRRLEFGLQRRNARLQGFVFLPRQPGHVLDGLEFLALDHVHVAQDTFGLGANDGIEFPPHALILAAAACAQASECSEVCYISHC